jgi:hypothetical protein
MKQYSRRAEFMEIPAQLSERVDGFVNKTVKGGGGVFGEVWGISFIWALSL